MRGLLSLTGDDWVGIITAIFAGVIGVLTLLLHRSVSDIGAAVKPVNGATTTLAQDVTSLRAAVDALPCVSGPDCPVRSTPGETTPVTPTAA